MTTAVLHPRDYQDQCKAALQGNEPNNRVAILPTGAGKTIVFSHLAKEHFEATGQQSLILVHTDELVDQAYRKMRAVAPGLRVGIIKSWRNDIRADVMIGSVATLRNAKRLAQLDVDRIGLGVVDECHHARAAGYQRIMGHLNRTAWRGVTATLIRGDGKGLGSVWHGGVAFKHSISWMVRHGLGEDGYTSIPVAPGYGYLLDPRGKRIEIDGLDLSTVKRSGGDFQGASLGAELSRSLAPEICARAYLEHASDRSGIAFWPTVASAYEFEAAANAIGLKTETVHGTLDPTERRNILRRLHEGTTQVVSNCMVLTEGFDSPRVSCVMIGRATRSPGLFQQMAGRGLRPFTDPATGVAQRDCLLLCVGGSSSTQTLASLVDLSEDQVRIRDGQSLTEAEDELAELEDQQQDPSRERIVLPDYRYRGKTVAVDFDPLARASKVTWMATTGGTYFISAGDCYVFLMPSVQSGAGPDAYDVLWTRKDRKAELTYDGVTGFWGFTSHTAIPLDYAFAWGEEVASELGGDPFGLLQMKDRRWRKQEPTEAQCRAALMRDIEIPQGANRGDVSVLLDTWAASQMIDPAVSYFQSQKEVSV